MYITAIQNVCLFGFEKQHPTTFLCEKQFSFILDRVSSQPLFAPHAFIFRSLSESFPLFQAAYQPKPQAMS